MSLGERVDEPLSILCSIIGETSLIYPETRQMCYCCCAATSAAALASARAAL
jgi:hypothetical protein